MKPFILFVVVSVLSLFALKIIYGRYDLRYSVRIGMSIMLLFTALGHFLFPDGMAMMIPEFIPFKKELIYFTAIIEIVGAIGLHIPQFRLLTSWLLIVFFVLLLPANIKASISHLNYQKGTFDGPGIAYLWFRIPLQILFILSIYFSSIRK
ncbi:MAG: hypothetical protein HRT58_11320 [Crocinitomicaceae bacterium]|nr:hypothetical protein [Flavobacteriales bacterium]NQZ36247.1 hypothetical protein [Crocinitomicaceae bacterium]